MTENWKQNMIFTFDERPSDSPFVERIWRTQSERTGDFLSIAASQWEMVVSKYQGESTVTVRGPETKATPLHVTLVGGEFFGIIFRFGTFMPSLPVSNLVDESVDLPDASDKSFWLHGSAWQFPNYENADTFVDGSCGRICLSMIQLWSPCCEANHRSYRRAPYSVVSCKPPD